MVGVLIAPELVDGQDEHAWRENYQYYGLLTGQADWGAYVTLIAGATINGLIVTGDLRVSGNTYLGASAANVLEVTATSTFKAGAAFESNVQLGDTSADQILVMGTSTFSAPVTNNATLTQNGAAGFTGAVTLGNAAADAIVVNGTASFNAPVTVVATSDLAGNVLIRNAGGTNVALFADTATPRVIIGANSPMAGTSGDRLQVVNGRAYVASGDTQAIGLRSGTGNGSFFIGASAAAAPDMVFSNNGGTIVGRWLTGGMLNVGTSTAPQFSERFKVDGDANVTGTMFISGNTALSLVAPQTVAAGARTLDGYYRQAMFGQVRYVPYYL